MIHALKLLWTDESGEDLVEYGLLAAFAAAVGTVVLFNDPVGFKPALVGAFKNVRKALDRI